MMKISKTQENNQSSEYFNELLTLNPFDHQLNIKSNIQFNNFDTLPFEILIYINEFLDNQSILKFREVNRNLLLHHISYNRLKLYISLKSIIINNNNNFDFSCLYNITSSAFYLNSLKKPLRNLLNYESRKNNIQQNVNNNNVHIDNANDIDNNLDFDSVTKLDDFLLLTLKFYRHNDIIGFLELFEVILKSKIFKIDDIYSYLNYSPFSILYHSCKMNLLCTGKSLLQYSRRGGEITALDLCACSVICLSFDHFELFKVLLLSLKTKIFNQIILMNLLYKTLNVKSSKYLEEIFIIFPETRKSFSSLCLFDLIESENLEIIKVILEYRKDIDFNLNQYIKVNGKYFNPIEFAIMKSFNSLKILIEIICETKYLDEIYDNTTISSIINNCISNQNINALKLILENILSRSLIDFYFLEKYNSNNYIEFNPIFFTIKSNFIDGLKALINHFGPKVLIYKDYLGRSPFLFALTNEDYSTAHMLAIMNSEIIHHIDTFGNNALHYILNQNQNNNCFELIKTFMKFGFNLEQVNSIGVKPLDLLKNLKNFIDEDQMKEIINEKKNIPIY